MVRLAIVRGLIYTDTAQVRGSWLVPTYATTYRWTGNRADAEDLTEWVFHNLGRDFGTSELVQVVEERLAQLTFEAIVRHWWERYGVTGLNPGAFPQIDSRLQLEYLLTDLTAELHLMLIRRFVRRRPIARIADQLRVSIQEADRLVFVALAEVAGRIGFTAPSSTPRSLDEFSAFITDIVARRPLVRFEARSGLWPVLVAACHLQAAIAGNDLPTQRFVRSLDVKTRLVTEQRIWSA